MLYWKLLYGVLLNGRRLRSGVAGPRIDSDVENAVRDDADFDADAWLRKHDVDAWYRMHTGRDLQPDIRKDLGRFFAWLALASLIGFAVTGDGRWVWGGMVFLVDRVLSTWWRAE